MTQYRTEAQITQQKVARLRGYASLPDFRATPARAQAFDAYAQWRNRPCEPALRAFVGQGHRGPVVYYD